MSFLLCPCSWGNKPSQVKDQCFLLFSSSEKFLSCPSQCWLSSTLIELWSHKFSPCNHMVNSISVILPCQLISFTEAIHFLFYCPSSGRTLLSQASSLSNLLDFRDVGIACSCAFKNWCLRSGQHWCTPVSSKAVSQGTLLTNLTPGASWNQLSPYAALMFLW